MEAMGPEPARLLMADYRSLSPFSTLPSRGWKLLFRINKYHTYRCQFAILNFKAFEEKTICSKSRQVNPQTAHMTKTIILGSQMKQGCVLAT